MQRQHRLNSLLIDSDDSVLMAADLSAMIAHRPAHQARQRALSLPAHLCICTLPPLLSAPHARVSMPSLH